MPGIKPCSSLPHFRAGFKYKWIGTNSSDQLKIIRENKSKDCLIGWYKNSDREKYTKYTSHIYEDDDVIVIVLSSKSVSEIKYSSLKQLIMNSANRLLIKENYSYGEYIDGLIQKYTPKSVSVRENNIEILELLSQGKADYFITTNSEVNLMLFYVQNEKTMMHDFYKITFPDSPVGIKRYILCSKMVANESIDKINRAIYDIR